MNMPTHIMAKPAQAAGGTLSVPVWEMGCTLKRGVFGVYANGQYKKIKCRKYQRIPGQAENKRENC